MGWKPSRAFSYDAEQLTQARFAALTLSHGMSIRFGAIGLVDGVASNGQPLE